MCITTCILHVYYNLLYPACVLRLVSCMYITTCCILYVYYDLLYPACILRLVVITAGAHGLCYLTHYRLTVTLIRYNSRNAQLVLSYSLQAHVNGNTPKKV